MNRRNLFTYIGAAAVTLSLPATVIASRRISVIYLNDPTDPAWRRYKACVRWPHGGIAYFSADAEGFTHTTGRQFLERRIRIYEKIAQKGPVSDAVEMLMHVLPTSVPKVWV